MPRLRRFVTCMATPHDPKSVAGKSLPVQESCQLLVIGAGPAGLAAAAHACAAWPEGRAGRMRIRCRPRSWAMTFRCTSASASVPAARNRTAMLEAFIAREPAIAELFDAGRGRATGHLGLGPLCQRSERWLAARSGRRPARPRWKLLMLGCERVIVAAGRRDMGLAFPGWDLPWRAWHHRRRSVLSERFGILDARRVVVLGTSAEALVGGAIIAERRCRDRCAGRGRTGTDRADVVAAGTCRRIRCCAAIRCAAP